MKVTEPDGKTYSSNVTKNREVKANTVTSLTLYNHDLQTLLDLSPSALKDRVKVLSLKFKKLV